MTHYRVQEWPDMPGDGGEGDAVVFSSDWNGGPGVWERVKSWTEAWQWISGNCNPGDTVEVLPAMSGQRTDDYTPSLT